MSLIFATSAAIMGIGQYFDLVAALTGRKSIVKRNTDLELLGTKCGAACHDSCESGFMNPMFSSCVQNIGSITFSVSPGTSLHYMSLVVLLGLFQPHLDLLWPVLPSAVLL